MMALLLLAATHDEQVPPDPPDPPEPGPNDEHNAQVEAMLAAGPDEAGRYLDPVSGRRFPKGQHMIKNPTRVQRRRLTRWRETGSVEGGPFCPVEER